MKKYLSRYFYKSVFRSASLVLVFCFLITPTFALIISEIQFDPSGSDTDREWIEIFNDTNSGLDLTIYKFFENNTNHGIDILSGDKNLLSGEYVVLVQDLNKFKIDFPGYVGKVFKSSFSLSNSGEALSLKDKDGVILNSVTYSPSQTGAGDGITINFDATNYTKGNPTPGSGNLIVGNISNQNSQNSTSTATSTTATTTESILGGPGFSSPIYYYRSYFPESEKVYAYIGENKIGIAGADVVFSANAITGDKKSIVDTNTNYFWNFGDGEFSQGKIVRHVYRYSGEYVVNLECYSNGQLGEDKIYIKIVDPEIKIKLGESQKQKFVEISNLGKNEINLGELLLSGKGGDFEKTYTFPKKFSIMPSRPVKIAFETLKFATSTNSLSLVSVNGKVLDEYLMPALRTNLLQGIQKTLPIASGTVSIYTKQDFEVLQKNILATSTEKVAKKFKKQFKISEKNELKLNDLPKEIARKEVFEVKNEKGVISNWLNYFGI